MPADEMGSRGAPQSPEVASRVVVIAVFSFLAFVALSMGGLMLYYRWLVPGNLHVVPKPVPEPTLQISPQEDLGRFQREQRAALDGFTWVDRGREIARIPIEDAMRVVAARGVRAYEPAGVPAVTPGPGSRGGVRP
jgi:hypothetical protein